MRVAALQILWLSCYRSWRSRVGLNLSDRSNCKFLLLSLIATLLEVSIENFQNALAWLAGRKG